MTDKKKAEIMQRCEFANWTNIHCPALPNAEFKDVLGRFMRGHLVVVRQTMTRCGLKVEVFSDGPKG